MIELIGSFDLTLLAAFIAAGLLLNITPGPDFVFIAATGIAGGPRAGVAGAVGVNLGVAVHVGLAAAGVSALLIAYPLAFDAVRYAGAAYLVYLAVQAWRADGHVDRARAAVSPWAAMRRGFVTNVLNPKTALFIFAFIPQFTDPRIGPVWAQIVILGAIFLVNGFLFSLALGSFAGALADRLRSRIRVLHRVTAILFGGLAARLVLD